MNQSPSPTAVAAPAAAAPPAPAAPAPPRRTFKAGLFVFTERFGHMMSRILLTLLYCVLVAPAGLVMALFGDPLRIRRYRGSSWSPWERHNDTPEQARRQD